MLLSAILTVSVYICNLLATVTSQCTNYNTDLVNPLRSTVYASQEDQAYLCDYLLDEALWYRLDSYVGTMMPESCVTMDHCGTEYPIWMNDSHPTAADRGPFTVQVCSPAYNDTTCCDSWTETIQVELCDGTLTGKPDFFVYKLKKPWACSFAYCFGSGEPCEMHGLLWNPTNQTCSEHYPSMSDVPSFDGYMHTNATNCTTGYVPFLFQCTVQYPQLAADDGALFEVSLYFDQYSAITKTTNNTNLVVHFESEEITGHFPYEITYAEEVSCKVRSIWTHLINFYSSPHYSLPFDVWKSNCEPSSTTGTTTFSTSTDIPTTWPNSTDIPTPRPTVTIPPVNDGHKFLPNFATMSMCLLGLLISGVERPVL